MHWPIYEQYNRMLSAYNAVDFDDLIRLPALLFTRNPAGKMAAQDSLPAGR